MGTKGNTGSKKVRKKERKKKKQKHPSSQGVLAPLSVGEESVVARAVHREEGFQKVGWLALQMR